MGHFSVVKSTETAAPSRVKIREIVRGLPLPGRWNWKMYQAIGFKKRRFSLEELRF